MDTSRDVTISHVYDITLLVVVFLKCGMNGQKERDEEQKRRKRRKGFRGKGEGAEGKGLGGRWRGRKGEKEGLERKRCK